MKAALYLRVSTEEQAENYSIPSQKERLEAFAKSQDWGIYDLYIDDGYSGKDMDRPAVKRLLKDAREKKFDIVAVYRLDRFSRRAVDLLKAVEEIFEPNRVALKSATEPFDTSTIAGRMMLTMLVAFAQFERESISERVKTNMLHKANGGEWCGAYMAPFGYRNENKKLYIVEHEATIVRQIFEKYNSGVGLRSIALALNESGRYTRQGYQWLHPRIRQILINPIYAGYMVWNRTERKGKKQFYRPRKEWVLVNGEHEPIISKDLFNAVQDRMKGKNHTSPRDSGNYALSGLVWCGTCGYKYRGCAKNAEVRYYRCGGYVDGAKCPARNIRVEILEDAVLTELEKLEFNEQGCMEAIKAAHTRQCQEEQTLRCELVAQQEELKKIEHRKSRLFDALEAEAISLSDVQQRMSQINKEKDTMERRLEEIATKIARIQLKATDINKKLDNLKNIRAKWENAAPLERQMLARSIIHRIIVIDRERFKLEVFD